MTEQTKSDQTRQRILTAGHALVAKQGFGAVGLAKVLSESGVPKGSFYYYFSSKETFGQALLQDYVDRYLARFDALIATDSTAAEKLDAFWSAWLAQAGSEGIASQCLVVKLGAEVADLSDSMRETLNAGFTQLVDRIATLLEQGSVEGTVRKFPDTLVTAQMLYAKWLGAAILSKLSRSQSPLEQALAETTQQLTPNRN